MATKYDQRIKDAIFEFENIRAARLNHKDTSSTSAYARQRENALKHISVLENAKHNSVTGKLSQWDEQDKQARDEQDKQAKRQSFISDFFSRTFTRKSAQDNHKTQQQPQPEASVIGLQDENFGEQPQSEASVIGSQDENFGDDQETQQQPQPEASVIGSQDENSGVKPLPEVPNAKSTFADPTEPNPYTVTPKETSKESTAKEKSEAPFSPISRVKKFFSEFGKGKTWTHFKNIFSEKAYVKTVATEALVDGNTESSNLFGSDNAVEYIKNKYTSSEKQELVETVNKALQDALKNAQRAFDSATDTLNTAKQDTEDAKVPGYQDYQEKINEYNTRRLNLPSNAPLGDIDKINTEEAEYKKNFKKNYPNIYKIIEDREVKLQEASNKFTKADNQLKELKNRILNFSTLLNPICNDGQRINITSDNRIQNFQFVDTNTTASAEPSPTVVSKALTANDDKQNEEIHTIPS